MSTDQQSDLSVTVEVNEVLFELTDDETDPHLNSDSELSCARFLVISLS